MEKCLIDNIICPEQNRRCDVCKLNSCAEVMKMLDDELKYIDKSNLAKLKKNLPKECRECRFLEIINLTQHRVYCPYRVNNRCLIEMKKT